MGEVYRANDTRLKRQVAIKFLSATLANAEARRRFQREAQLASSLNHPHILTVYDAGELEDRQYLVTELIDGGTLSEWASAKPRSSHEIADLLSGVADGLAAAHEAGIVHRDIKPANVLVGRNGYAPLVDFGLAKLQEQPDEDTPTVTAVNTRLGLVVGTVRYMSPEQAAGKRLDRRSDVFSFGVMLYESSSPAVARSRAPPTCTCWNRFSSASRQLSMTRCPPGGRSSSELLPCGPLQGDQRQISDFAAGFEIRDFDLAPDGSRILFDRLRTNSDVVLMERDRRD
jgi:serine/threonine protein kinase